MSHGECSLPGYYPLEFTTRNDSPNSKGAIGIYVKDIHKYKVRSDLSIFVSHVFESKFIELTFNKKQIIIGTIYIPNSFPHDDVGIFSHNMNNIMGDMNIDLITFSDHRNTRIYLENMFVRWFLPLIVKPTRLTSHSTTL
ncbi:hypothetical protein LSH36_1595g00004 [Paralvinella palmiformis]|uniref:Uncharacterized protein n=1 Tax=Paralvinella palmiformis TaxID=53620 RepID=A0AAD9IS26_9ANNE|nr:hypothetical protein LSH36_1595g00004 [Paralvinella palmiformis]